MGTGVSGFLTDRKRGQQRGSQHRDGLREGGKQGGNLEKSRRGISSQGEYGKSRPRSISTAKVEA